MATLDIGIDLGTSTILASDSARKAIIREPSIVAVNRRTGNILNIGSEVYNMIGRTPDNIQIIHPLEEGVISDYRMTEVLIKYLLRRINYNQLLKPRLSVCVPSGITEVESKAVMKAAMASGARKVYLLEEPVAAAIGAGLNLALPTGNLIVDVGGGTCDVAVLSFNGIVCKSSVRVAGMKFDEAITKYIRNTYNLLIGEKTAEMIKIEIGSVLGDGEERETFAKGRDLISGLPKKIMIRRSELIPVLFEVAEVMVREVQSVLEKTPPELISDIRDNGLVLTGGGALIHGLDRLLERETRVPARIAENAVECVAIGTAASFRYLDTLLDGFAHMLPVSYAEAEA